MVLFTRRAKDWQAVKDEEGTRQSKRLSSAETLSPWLTMNSPVSYSFAKPVEVTFYAPLPRHDHPQFVEIIEELWTWLAWFVPV